MNKDDFLVTICNKNALTFWGDKPKEYIKNELAESISVMKDFDQRNPHHCYTLMEHCLRAVDSLEDHSERNGILKTAAFFHDMAKPIVAKEKDGRLVFYGHAELSAQMVVPILHKLGYNTAEIADIRFLVCHHDDFISYVLEKNYIPKSGKIAITKATIQKYYDRLKAENSDKEKQHLNLLLRELIAITIADVFAQSFSTIKDGKECDSRAAKILRLNAIGEILNSIC